MPANESSRGVDIDAYRGLGSWVDIYERTSWEDPERAIAGMRDHFEIWDRAAWARELAEVEGSAEDVAERLAAKND